MLVSVVALAGWLSACGTTAPPSADRKQSAWTLFTDGAGGFSVLMPMRPQETVKALPRASGPAIKSHQFIVDPDPSIELGVFYNDYPGSLPNIQILGSPSFFDTVQEGALKELGEAHLISAWDGAFASHPMREFRFEVPDKKLICRIRVIVVGHRMYQLLVASTVGVDVSHEVDTLFNSFQLLYD